MTGARDSAPCIRLAIAILLALGVCCGAGLPVAGASTTSVPIRVPVDPSVRAKPVVSFQPRARLPRGGYYYAVAVLVGYADYSLASPPPCAVTSDMQATAYGFPRNHARVTLALRPAPSTAGEWCAGGTYDGAVYGVPHRPSCKGTNYCQGRSAEYGPCGGQVCGVIVKPEPEPTPQPGPKPEPPLHPTTYSYPGGLPKPADRSAHVVGRFVLRFPAG